MQQLVYFMQAPVPSRRAETIQVLRTADALVREHDGWAVTVVCGRIDPGWESYYDIAPHPRLRLVNGYPLPRRRSAARAAVARILEQARSLGRDMAGTAEPAGRSGGVVAMSRGEAAGQLAPLLPAALPWVTEMHRPCLASLAESDPDHGENARPGPVWRRPYVALRRRRAVAREHAALRRAQGWVWLTPGVRDTLRARHRLPDRPETLLPSGVTLPAPPLSAPPSSAPPPFSLSSSDSPSSDPASFDTSPQADLPTTADGPVGDVLYVGKLEDRKGVDVLLRAAALLPPDARVGIVGGSAAQVADYRNRAADLGLGSERVRWWGHLPPAELPERYRGARVGVCPLPAGRCPIAERYTSPMKILEMMARGLAVIASDLPTVRDLIEHGRTGWLVPPNDPAALAEAIRLLRQDRGLAERLGSAAARRARDFAWPRRARTLADLLQQVCPPTPEPPTPL